MKKIFLLLIAAASGLAATAQDFKTPYITKPLPADLKKVFVNTSGGSISVSGTGEEPRVEVYIRGNNMDQSFTKDEITKALQKDYIFSVEVSGGELHATAKRKGSFNFNGRRSLSVSFKVYTGRQVSSNLNTSGGSISLASLTGTQNFETSGGSLSINDVAGVIKGETSGGSINVSNSKNDIDLETSGGSITANNCQGNIRLETSGGSLKLDNLNGNIKANTSGGSVNGSKITGELYTGTSGGSINLMAVSGSVDASTSAGSVHVQMLKVGKFVKLDTGAGHIDLELPTKQGLNLDVTGNRITIDMEGTFSGSKEKEKVFGKLNGGGPVVEIRGDSGVSLTTE
ncbi:DUF4097 family beta strand repeat-containing protein [Mucilaginibacter pallidiroseus]|nr:DUF4097 domain-containing protein [Mucilaginibacter pallidiroseus]